MNYLNERIELFKAYLQDLNPIVNDDVKQWLIDNGFFTSPCSTNKHNAYEGGLFDHSFNVMSNLLNLTYKLNLQWERPISPIIVGMFHDICKMDQYIYNNETKMYSWNAHQKDVGHGDKSVRILLNFLDLTNEEKACIEYHMGAFTDKSKWSEYTLSIQKYPNILYTNLADMLATYVDEVK